MKTIPSRTALKIYKNKIIQGDKSEIINSERN